MKHVTNLIGLGALLLTLGCTTTSSHYLPRNAKVVGGGLRIDWQAPSNGTVILVEANTRAPLITKFVEAEDSFEFNPASDSADQAVFEAMLPQTATNAQLILYFVPAPTKD